MTKSISSASSIVVPSISVLHLVNGAKFLDDTWGTEPGMIAILHPIHY